MAFKFICLFLLISMGLSCKTHIVNPEKGYVVSEPELHEAALVQQIKEASPQDTDYLEKLQFELKEVQSQKYALGRIFPIPKPNPCMPTTICPRKLNLMDQLILTGEIKMVTLQNLDAQGQVLSEAHGKWNSYSPNEGYSKFNIGFQNEDIKGAHSLMVKMLDVDGKEISYKLGLGKNL